MAGNEIALEQRPRGGRYVLRMDGEEAELTFSRVGEHLIMIDHTFTPRAFRGRGIALKLLERAVADARAVGDKVIPLCSFAAGEFRARPEWADLLQKRP